MKPNYKERHLSNQAQCPICAMQTSSTSAHPTTGPPTFEVRYAIISTYHLDALRLGEELMIKFNSHALRHTHATELIESGISPKSVQTRLGHKNIETTLNTYVHDTPKMKDDAVEAIEKTAHGMNFLWSNRGQESFLKGSDAT